MENPKGLEFGIYNYSDYAQYTTEGQKTTININGPTAGYKSKNWTETETYNTK